MPSLFWPEDTFLLLFSLLSIARWWWKIPQKKNLPLMGKAKSNLSACAEREKEEKKKEKAPSGHKREGGESLPLPLPNSGVCAMGLSSSSSSFLSYSHLPRSTYSWKTTKTLWGRRLSSVGFPQEEKASSSSYRKSGKGKVFARLSHLLKRAGRLWEEISLQQQQTQCS